MLKPLADHVVVKPYVQEAKTESGIFLPDTASKDKPQTGTVVAVGSGKIVENGTRVPSELKAGQQVVFTKYAGNEVRVDGVDYVILREQEILAVIGEATVAKKTKK